MFPLRDENPTLRASLVTYLIILVNILVWVFIQGMGSEPSLINSVCKLGLIPGELLGKVSEGHRVPLGRNLVCILDGKADWYTLVSHMFAHGGWFHIIGNLWFLAIFGDNVEDSMGRIKFLFFYLLCGLAAAATQIWTNPSSTIPMVGASGAIGGVMGAYAVLYPRSPVHMLVIFGIFIDRVIVPAYFMLAYWFLIQLLSAIPTLGGAEGGVAFWAHVGGFLAGVILIPFFKDKKRVEAHRKVVFRRWGR
ncbi:MAG: rhomboid family intramembrane serine protease [Fibrobacter sp.]|jgi:membrane associated rhomboid family serine protease|nr:rhomboid family intramembrane serine protease [Fibrobacter sp.]